MLISYCITIELAVEDLFPQRMTRFKFKSDILRGVHSNSVG